MAGPEKKYFVKFLVPMTPEMRLELHEYYRAHEIPSEAEAIRQFIRLGLDMDKARRGLPVQPPLPGASRHRRIAPPMQPADLIEATLGSWVVRGKTYHTPLPAPLARWYCYTSDGGHSLLVAVAERYQRGSDPENSLVAAPVKTVLAHPWHEEDGYIIVDGLSYDSEVGLRTPPEDDEF